MLRVGLTGGIGSGKSTAAARLVERGAVLVDLARRVLPTMAGAAPAPAPSSPPPAPGPVRAIG